MADWNLPTLLSTETEYTDTLKDRDVDLAKQFDGTTSTNLPDGAIRWNSTNRRWEKLVSGIWEVLEALYAIKVENAAQADNSDTVDGSHASQTPTANTIPIADSNGKIATGWLPDTEVFPSGTKMLFLSSLPPGWTLDTTISDRVISVVSDSTIVGQTGGGWTITGLSASTTVAGHALTIDEIPPHSHQYYKLSVTYDSTSGGDPIYRSPTLVNTTTVGGGQPHSHGASTTVSHDGSWRPAYINAIIGIKS